MKKRTFGNAFTTLWIAESGPGMATMIRSYCWRAKERSGSVGSPFGGTYSTLPWIPGSRPPRRKPVNISPSNVRLEGTDRIIDESDPQLTLRLRSVACPDQKGQCECSGANENLASHLCGDVTSAPGFTPRAMSVVAEAPTGRPSPPS